MFQKARKGNMCAMRDDAFQGATKKTSDFQLKSFNIPADVKTWMESGNDNAIADSVGESVSVRSLAELVCYMFDLLKSNSRNSSSKTLPAAPLQQHILPWLPLMQV